MICTDLPFLLLTSLIFSTTFPYNFEIFESLKAHYDKINLFLNHFLFIL